MREPDSVPRCIRNLRTIAIISESVIPDSVKSRGARGQNAPAPRGLGNTSSTRLDDSTDVTEGLCAATLTGTYGCTSPAERTSAGPRLSRWSVSARRTSDSRLRTSTEAEPSSTEVDTPPLERATAGARARGLAGAGGLSVAGTAIDEDGFFDSPKRASRSSTFEVCWLMKSGCSEEDGAAKTRVSTLNLSRRIEAVA